MAPRNQKALILPERQDDFVVEKIKVPRPEPSEVLVKVMSAGLNSVDWRIQFHGALIADYPAILGSEAAGVVEEVGSAVHSLVKGDRVFFQGFFNNPRGTFQQYCIVQADLAAKIPPSLSYDQAAALPVAIGSVVLPMYNEHPQSGSAHFTPPWSEGGPGRYAGRSALIIGGSSSVGQCAIQMAKLSGFSPIITTASPRNSALLVSLGATHVLDRDLSQSELLSQIKTISGKAPLLFVYDSISYRDTQILAYKALLPGGVGIFTHPFRIPPEHLDARESKIIINAYGSVFVPVNQETGAILFKKLPEWLERGVLKPNRVEVLPGGLNAIPAGLRRLQNGDVSACKLVVHPQETPDTKS